MSYKILLIEGIGDSYLQHLQSVKNGGKNISPIEHVSNYAKDVFTQMGDDVDNKKKLHAQELQNMHNDLVNNKGYTEKHKKYIDIKNNIERRHEKEIKDIYRKGKEHIYKTFSDHGINPEHIPQVWKSMKIGPSGVGRNIALGLGTALGGYTLYSMLKAVGGDNKKEDENRDG